MAQYKHITNGNVIDDYEYELLASFEKANYREIDDSGDFIMSAIIGAATGSAILGGLLGGSFTGGIVGDLLDGDLMD